MNSLWCKWKQWGAGLAILVALLLGGRTASARPLSPFAVEEVQRLFKAAPAGFAVLEVASLDKDRLRVTLCQTSPELARQCFPLELSDPQASCPGQVVNDTWCVRFLAEPPPATRALLVHVLSAACSTTVWASQEQQAHWSRPPPPLWKQELSAYGLALVVLLLPWLLGLVLGRQSRRITNVRTFSEKLPAGIPVLLLLAALLAIPSLPLLSAWDVLLMVVLLGTGFFLGSRPWTLRHLLLMQGLVVGTATGALLVLELLARLVLTPPPGAPLAARDAHFILGHEVRDYSCTLLYPEDDPMPVTPQCGKPTSPRVLHVGDSMVWGAEVQPAQTFTAELGRLAPNVVHLNAGVSNTGPDYQYLLLKQRLERSVVDLAVVYFYTENDVQDMDRPFDCCEEGPLLSYSDEGAQQRCERPNWKYSLRQLLGRSPPPYPLRVAATVSRLAARTNEAFINYTWRAFMVGSREPVASEATWKHIELAFKGMRDETKKHGVPLVVVVLPFRTALVAPHPEQTEAAHVRDHAMQVLGQLGIPALDAWPLVADALRQKPDELHWFASASPTDGHFSPAGHKLLADWLAPRLQPYLDKAAPLSAATVP